MTSKETKPLFMTPRKESLWSSPFVFFGCLAIVLYGAQWSGQFVETMWPALAPIVVRTLSVVGVAVVVGAGWMMVRWLSKKESHNE